MQDIKMPPEKYQSTFSQSLAILIAVLAAKALVIVLLILHGGIGLGPDEAQYWTWSRLPDWGYYSKPPGIAWEILLGTYLFGNTELGVRAMPVAIGFALPLIVFFMAKCARLTPSNCLWSGLCLAVSPLGVLASFLAITDGGMILFWSLACVSLISSIEEKKQPNYVLLGGLVFLGALFKWPVYSFWIIVAGAWILCPWMISWRSVRAFLSGIAISLLAFLPSVYWNVSHEWATFRHVSATLTGGHAASPSGNPLEFFGAQALLVSPILFILLLMGWGRLLASKLYKKENISKGIALCGLSSLLIITAGVITACVMKIQGNWLIFAYLMDFVFLAWYAENKKRWLAAGVALAIAAGTFVYAIPTIQANNLLSTQPIPYKINPFRHNVGWQHLGKVLTQAGYDLHKDFLFGDQYQTTSILSFYGPQQKKAYFLNLRGARKNQFSFWPGMAEEQQGKRGFFVAIENATVSTAEGVSEKYLKLLRPYFHEVRLAGIYPIFQAYDKPVKVALVYIGDGYNGTTPTESVIY